MMTGRQNISTGTSWEAIAGYSRAVKIGGWICVSGTTATDENGALVAPNDPYGQTVYILDKIERALNALGASLNDVIRTRIYLVDVSQWEAVARAHGERFGDIRPANTLVEVSGLVGDGYLVEIEADAVIVGGAS